MPSMKSENPTSRASPSALKALFLASRPKTWVASLSPVCIGAALAPQFDLLLFCLTLLFSLFIQIGTNYANDYFDFIKGADHLRNGPKRATQEGWISPSAMWMATRLVFALSLLIALPLMIRAGIWSFFLAFLCVLLGIFYTGGPKPLGYLGLSELFVFSFFGLTATCGSYFLQTLSLTHSVFLASFAPGLLSCSILIANNLRDEKSDRAAKKMTLIARFGKRFGALEYTGALLGALLIPLILVFAYGFSYRLLSTLAILFVAIPSIKKVFTFRDSLELIAVLQQSALLLALYTLLFCISL